MRIGSNPHFYVERSPLHAIAREVIANRRPNCVFAAEISASLPTLSPSTPQAEFAFVNFQRVTFDNAGLAGSIAQTSGGGSRKSAKRLRARALAKLASNINQWLSSPCAGA
jgi:hypothetical protein